MRPLLDPSLLRQACFVDGAWVTSDRQHPVRNPASGDLIGHVPWFDSEIAQAAIDAAVRAFPGWASVTAKERSATLRRWYTLVMENREDLATILTSEQGKPIAEARSEIDYAAGFIEFFAEEAKRVYGETIPPFREGSRILVLRQPAGVVAAITPWNFPAAMITRKCAPALAVGCPVVLKPAEDTPLTALALASLAEDAGFPAGVLNVVTGPAEEIGDVLTRHPAVRVVAFTGSTEVGRILMRKAADGIKRVALELGGNAPFIVFDDADLDAAVAGAVVAKFRNAGQTCVCANRIFVQAGIHDAFVEKFALAVAKLKVGDGFEPDVVLGPLISEAAVAKVESHLSDATRRGARILVGGRRHPRGRTFFEATVVTEVTSTMQIAHEETFGPVAALFRFATEPEVIREANAGETGLAAYFYARDIGRVMRVAEALECGMVGVNSGLISSEVVPFGGVKQSGIGREGSRLGMEEFLAVKYVLLDGLNAGRHQAGIP